MVRVLLGYSEMCSEGEGNVRNVKGRRRNFEMMRRVVVRDLLIRLRPGQMRNGD